MPLTVLFDANVLYPAPLRDLLLHLSFTNLFLAKWTDEIHDEWIRNVLKKRADLKIEQLNRTRLLMNQAVEDCLVTDYKALIPSLDLPDPDDRQVLAAAITANAEIIVSYNLKDFPSDVLEGFGIAAQNPDDFITSLLNVEPNLVLEAIRKQRANLKNPAVDVASLLSAFKQLKLLKTVKTLEEYRELL